MRTAKTLAATLAFVWLGCLVYVLLEQAAGALTFREFDVDPVQRIHFITLYYWLPWLLFAPLIALLSSRLPMRPDNWPRALAAHVGALMTLSLLHGLVDSYAYYYSGSMTAYMATFAPWQHSGHILFGDHMLLFDVIFYAVVAASLNIRSFHGIVLRQELDAARLRAHLAELRFQTLRMQINPHFLFNVLNALAVLVRKKDTERADEMIRRLSQFLRQTLEGSDEHWVPLEEELEMTRQYLAIAQIRFGERLCVRETCDPDVRRAKVPALLLQPLVENAVTHGLSNEVGPCWLSVECRRDGGRLRIDIRDSGVGGRFYADPAFKEGVGLTNVRSRLEQMYDGDYSFELQSRPGEGTHVTIELPLIASAPLEIAV